MSAAEKALAELTDISSQVRAAVLFDPAGKVLASTLPTERANGFAAAAKLLLENAERVRSDGEAKIAQLEAATGDGSVFVVAEEKHILAAATGSEPTSGLVLYDLKTCLRAVAEKPKSRSTPAKKKAAAATPKPKPKARRKADGSS